MKKMIRFLTIAVLFSTINARLLASDYFTLHKNTVLACAGTIGLVAGGISYLVTEDEVTYTGKLVEEDTPENESSEEQNASEETDKPKKKISKFVYTSEVRKRSVWERLSRAVPVGGIAALCIYEAISNIQSACARYHEVKAAKKEDAAFIAGFGKLKRLLKP